MKINTNEIENDEICKKNHDFFCSYHRFFSFFQTFCFNFINIFNILIMVIFTPIMERSYVCLRMICWRAKKHFDIHFGRIRSVHFPTQDRKVFNSRQSHHFHSIDLMMKVHFVICTLTWLVNNYVSGRGKSKNSRNQFTENNIYTDIFNQ